MIEAILYDDIMTSINKNKSETITVGILLTRPTLEAGKNILPNLNYYHHRSGETVNFFLPGFGAYWYGTYPDEKDIVVIDGVTWSFSSKMFADFIAELENHSTWRYSGDSELILVDCHDSAIDFSKVVVFRLDEMLRDKVIYSINNLFETIIRMQTSHNDASSISDKLGVKMVGQITVDTLLKKLPDIGRNFWIKGKHYAVKNCSK